MLKRNATINGFLFYSKTTNKLQSYTMVFITINALHVSGGSSAHHQELKTAYTASGICRVISASYCYRGCCVYSFELLMVGGGTA